MDHVELADTHPAVRRAGRVSHLLDEVIRIPVVDYRIGLDPILGLLPVAGDAVAAGLSLYVIAEAVVAGAPLWLVALMLVLVGIDLVVGSVPLVGTLFDAVWKPNVWNVRLLQRHLDA